MIQVKIPVGRVAADQIFWGQDSDRNCSAARPPGKFTMISTSLCPVVIVVHPGLPWSQRNGLSAVTNPIQYRRLGRLRLVYGLDAIEHLAEITLCDLNVIVVLQIEPKLWRCAESLGESKRGIGGNAGLFAGDPLDPSARQAARLGKSARRHLQRNQELLPQNLTGMHRLELLGHCRVSLF